MKLIRAHVCDAERIWKMQRLAFQDLLLKYRDFDTNPGNETKETVENKLKQPFTYFYFIHTDETLAGAVRVVDKKDASRKRVAPIFILKEFRNQGLAQMAFRAIEKIHGEDGWALDTILQEPGHCHLYEKLGYVKTGVTERINEEMDIVFYRKG